MNASLQRNARDRTHIHIYTFNYQAMSVARYAIIYPVVDYNDARMTLDIAHFNSAYTSPTDQCPHVANEKTDIPMVTTTLAY